MKLMFPKTPFAASLLILFVLSLVVVCDLSAQSKKRPAAKKAVAQKTVAKKNDKHGRDATKDRTSAKNAKKDDKKGKLTAREKAKEREQAKADAKAAKDPKNKKKGESKKEAAERRRKEEERRREALAEQRRREEAARIARERKLAFERGLRTETVANIQNDKTDGEDLYVRQAAVNALSGHAGSVVVMEAQTGKVLTIVNQDWAIRSSIKPCSTIKLVTGVAGLNEGVINKEDGSIRNTPSRRDLDDAIAFSDNGYFQRVGGNVGNAKMIEYAKKLGLGEPTGLNADGESAGKLAFGNNNARIYSHGDDFEVTGLQLAVLVSEITNGGNRVIPRVPRNTIEKTKFQTFYRAKLDLPQANVRRMIPGMMGAAAYGTAH
ncbi:MAG: penicillin-binding transpeptidase domain-containing protein, partial [Acidobacteriota bacterium]